MNAMQPVYESIQKHPWFEGMQGYQILGLSLYVGECDLAIIFNEILRYIYQISLCTGTLKMKVLLFIV